MVVDTSAGGGIPPRKVADLIVSGKKTVTAAGTAELLLAANTVTATIIVKALAGNSDTIYIGNVSGDVASTNGFELAPGEAIAMDIDNSITPVYLDSAVNGEGVSYITLV